MAETINPRTLSETKRGVAVECMVCGRTKKPVGRDSMDNGLCSYECPGYRKDPRSGSLWPGETEAEFGYAVGPHGVKEGDDQR